MPHVLSVLFRVSVRLLHQASIVHQNQHTRCNSASNKPQQFYIILLHSLRLLDTTSDAVVALSTLTTTVAVVWVGFSNINIAPGISQLLHRRFSNGNLSPSSQLLYTERTSFFLLCAEAYIATLYLQEAKTECNSYIRLLSVSQGETSTSEAPVLLQTDHVFCMLHLKTA